MTINLLYLGTGAVYSILKMANKYLEKKSLHFGLDYVVIYGTFNHEELFSPLNFENTDYGEIEDFVFNKVRVPKYLYGITFNYKNYKVFSYVKGDDTLKIPSQDALTIYGVAFKIMTLEEIRYFIEGYFTLKHLKRFDICVDVEDSIQNVLKKFKPLKQKGGKIFGKGGELETQYIGNPRRTINKRSLIRIYNKIADVKGSGKESLYMDYIEKDAITRIELEIRSELAPNIFYYELFEEENLKKLMKNYFRKHTSIFDDFSEEKMTLYRKPSEKTRDESHKIYYEKMYRLVFIGYARKIHNMGVCPVRLLIGRGLILDETRKIFGEEIVDIIKQEETILFRHYMRGWGK